VIADNGLPFSYVVVVDPAQLPEWEVFSRMVLVDGSTGEPVTVTQGAAVADATDALTAVNQLNALLASLRAAGVIAT
jgi:hypothetical protein